MASTLYAAAFFSGLDVLERLPHSRPSAYIPMGLDATVVYPDVDSKLRNPYAFPVAVHAKVDGNHLKVELLGASRPARRVQFTREILEALPYDRKVEEDAKLRGSFVRVKQHGLPGTRSSGRAWFHSWRGRRNGRRRPTAILRRWRSTRCPSASTSRSCPRSPPLPSWGTMRRPPPHRR